jgi:hypothetical protein
LPEIGAKSTVIHGLSFAFRHRNGRRNRVAHRIEREVSTVIASASR